MLHMQTTNMEGGLRISSLILNGGEYVSTGIARLLEIESGLSM